MNERPESGAISLPADVSLFGPPGRRPARLTAAALAGEGPAAYLVLSGCGRLKIGMVGWPKDEHDDRYTLKVRLYRLKTDACCPVTLLGAWPVLTNAEAEALEAHLHAAAAAERLKGEWFRCPTWEDAARFVALAEAAWIAITNAPEPSEEAG
jgi:hypothetical protein